MVASIACRSPAASRSGTQRAGRIGNIRSVYRKVVAMARARRGDNGARAHDPIMPRFQKTRLHAATAVLGLVGLYALAGLCYAAWMHSSESVTVWAVVAALAFTAAVVHQSYVARKRKRGP